MKWKNKPTVTQWLSLQKLASQRTRKKGLDRERMWYRVLTMFFTKDPILFPTNLSAHLHRHLQKEGGGVASELKVLWPKLAVEKGVSADKKNHYSSSKRQALAYALYYLPANLLKFPLILKELSLLYPEKFETLKNLKTIKVLDFGCGPGTVFWGSDIASREHGLSFEYLGFDQSRDFVDIGNSFAKDLLADNSNLKANFKQSDLSLQHILHDINQMKPNIIVFSNSIGEIFPLASKREEFTKELLKKMETFSSKESPCLAVFIEPALKTSSRELLGLRSTVLNSSHVLLPCLDNRACGALSIEGEWCHEAVAVDFPDWLSELGEKAGLRKEQVLFSYLVLEVGREDKGFPCGAARVVSQMMNEKGLTKCFMCTDKGRVMTRVLNSKVNEQNEIFLSSVRGSVFSDFERSEKGDFLTENYLVSFVVRRLQLSHRSLRSRYQWLA